MHVFLMLFLLSCPDCEPCVEVVVAERALAGDFGKLAPWQEEGYLAMREEASGDVDGTLAWITYYSQYEKGCGTRTASGQRVREGRTAAMLDVPFGSFVLLEVPGGYTLRQVWDRGSRANLRRARAKGAKTWCDIYVDTADRDVLNSTTVGRVWLVTSDRGKAQ